MRIDLVFPVLPPVIDGIGDHTVHLASALSRVGCNVRIWTAQADCSPLPGVEIRAVFDVDPPWKIRSLYEFILKDPPDWLFVQFNQFSYGRYGFNPWLPLTLRKIRRKIPNVRIAWMAHEDFVPFINWRFGVMTLWQRWQFWMLGRAADQVFFSVEGWADRYTSWFDAPVFSIPVGSNIPRVEMTKPEARAHVGLEHDAFVVGLFGTMGGARLLDHIREAIAALSSRNPHTCILYVGPDGDVVQDAFPFTRVIDAGKLPAKDVSIHLTAMDMHLAPFTDGLSTRRGSAMAGLQHGVATVSNLGPTTDSTLASEHGNSVLLAPHGDRRRYAAYALQLLEDSAMRARIGREGKALYDSNYRPDIIAQKLLCCLQKARGQYVDF